MSPLRMLFLVAGPAHAYQLAVPRTWVRQRQRKIGPVFEMLHMMDNHCTPVAVPCLAQLALFVIHLQDFSSDIFPFWPGVEQIRRSVINHGPQLLKP